MPNTECHFCTRQFDESEAKWFTPFGGGAQPADRNALQINAAIADRRVDGAVAICPTCLNARPQPGHTLVIERDGGRADVRKMNTAGVWDYVRDDLANLQTAHEIARNALERGCRVWFKPESQPDTAIRLY